jgi:hypothetical protein
MKQFFAILLLLGSWGLHAQVQVDQPIELTGTGSNARLTGIESVTNLEDATSADAVQRS